jgi:murein endopeptidase
MRPFRHIASYCALVVACQPLVGCNEASNDTPESISQLEQAVGVTTNDQTCVAGGTKYTNGTLLYSDRTSNWGLTNVKGTRLTVADINGDNYPDLIVRTQRHGWVDVYQSDRRSSFTVRVLKNNRNGGFIDVTASSGLLLGRTGDYGDQNKNGRASQVFAFADVDNDGDLDAFAGSEPFPRFPGPDLERSDLLINAGDGTFRPIERYPFVAQAMHPSGATFLDYNRDGFIDLFVPSKVQRTVSTNNWSGWLFQGTATVPYLDVTPTLGLTAQARFGQSSTACDLNDDGRPDLLVPGLERSPNAYWQATTTGGFSELGRTNGYAFDSNADWKDNLGAQAYCSYVRTNQVPVTTFDTQASCAAAPGGCPSTCTTFPCRTFRAVTAADNAAACQGVPEYAATGSEDTKFRNALTWDHKLDRTTERLGGNTYASLCADFDGDGRLDLLNAEVRNRRDGLSADATCVLKNDRKPDGSVAFSRPTAAAADLAIPFGSDDIAGGHAAEAFDMDNDGRPDLYLGSASSNVASRLYQNVSTPSAIRFQPVQALDAFSLGLSDGAAIADFDRDGDLDIVVGTAVRDTATGENTDGPLNFYENQLGSNGNWVELKLVGATGTNRSAIGARVTIDLDNGTKLVQEVDGGHGHFGAQGDQVLHFGLGSSCNVKVTVRWPDAAGTVQTFDVDARHRYRVVQGEFPGTLPIRGYCQNNVNAFKREIGPTSINDYYDIFCVQDRLSELGFKGRYVQLAVGPVVPPEDDDELFDLVEANQQRARRIPQPLNVNGLWTEDTKSAIQTFQTVLSGANGVHDTQTATISPGSNAIKWLNATNAPRWSKLPATGTGWASVDNGQNHDWGSQWMQAIINTAGTTISNDALVQGFEAPYKVIQINDLSVPCGGVTAAHHGHQSGLNLDVPAVYDGFHTWFDLDTLQSRLNRTVSKKDQSPNPNAFWSSPLPPKTPTPTDYCPWPTNGNALFKFAATDTNPRFAGSYGASASHIDAAIEYLWGLRSDSNSGCFHRIANYVDGASKTYDTARFDRGFDALIGTRDAYVAATHNKHSFRERTVRIIKAFIEQDAVVRVYYNDPIVKRDVTPLVTAAQADKIRSLTIHSHHLHVDGSHPAAPTP